MAPRHIHLDDSPPAATAWALDWPGEDDFDGAALEEAMIEARESAYRSLAELDAA